MTSALLIASVVAFVAAVLCTPLAARLGRVAYPLDVPNHRSSHATPTPRTGGFAIAAGAALGLLAARIAGVGLDTASVVVLGCTLAQVVLAFSDDMWNMHVAARFGTQLAIAVLVLLLASLVPAITGPDAAGATRVVVTLVAAGWIVWMTNAFNFMDGVNGIAGTQAVVCGACYALLFARAGDLAGAVVAGVVAGGAAGFLPWNFPRARIFMGDVGSAPLGFLFSVLLLRLVPTTGLVAAVLPLLPFVLDATVTLLRRMIAGERFWEAHRSHFYQRLSRRSGHAATTMTYGALALGGAILTLSRPAMSVAAFRAGVALLLALHAMAALVASRRDPAA